MNIPELLEIIKKTESAIGYRRRKEKSHEELS